MWGDERDSFAGGRRSSPHIGGPGSSDGKSARLLTERSLVQVQPGAPTIIYGLIVELGMDRHLFGGSDDETRNGDT